MFSCKLSEFESLPKKLSNNSKTVSDTDSERTLEKLISNESNIYQSLIYKNSLLSLSFRIYLPLPMCNQFSETSFIKSGSFLKRFPL